LMEEASRAGHFRDLFTPMDRILYLSWRLLGKRGAFRGRLRDGIVVSVRSCDWETAYEVFFLQVYRTPLDPSGVTRIIDLGGNVGFSCLYWTKQFPSAYIETFEPHPVHCDILLENPRMNEVSSRVLLHRAAAACQDGEGILSDKGVSSALLFTPRDCSIPVGTVDFFTRVGTSCIDILKMDIEGGEYEILADDRFVTLAPRIRYLIMEYHERDPRHLGGDWCEKRLRTLGFDLENERTQSDLGLIRARQSAPGHVPT